MSGQGVGNREHEAYCAAIEAESAGFVAVVEDADPAAPVPTCPDWTVGALIRHLGTVHRWAEHIVRHRLQQRVPPGDLDLGPPDAEADHPAWLAAGAGRLVATLRAADPATPVWTWGPDRSPGWWARRMLAETTVHRADAELALGRTPEIEPETAIDGIDEFLTNVSGHPRVAAQLAELGADGETVHLHATDSGGEWLITLRSDGFDWERAHGKGTVAVQGTACDLLLLTYGRLRSSDGRFTVFGDRGSLERWLEKSVL